MGIMISLVGEQPLPNFFPVYHYHPEETLFIYTARTFRYYQHLQGTLQKQTKIHGLEVDPYSVPAIAAQLQTKLEELALVPSSSSLFNLTGGTKPMVIAAYQIAQALSAPVIYLQSEGRQTRIYSYTWKGQLLTIQNDELVPECISLNTILDLHFGPGQWIRENPQRDDGGNFEQAIAEVLRKQGYEVFTNVKTMDKLVEIDIIVRLGNQYGIIEAKLGEAGRKFKGIQQLVTAWRSIGTYTQKFRIITIDPVEQHKMITDTLEIEVISLRSYDRATMTFSPDDQVLLLTSIEKALKG